MIVHSTLSVDDTSDISINGRHFRGTRGLLELLTRKNVNRSVVTTEDLKRYKTILQMTNAHLKGYEPGNNVQTSHGPKFREVTSNFIPQTTRHRGVELSLRQHCERYIMAGKLYFEPKHPSGYSTLNRLHAAARGKMAGELRAWIEAQDAYTLHRPFERDFRAILTR